MQFPDFKNMTGGEKRAASRPFADEDRVELFERIQRTRAKLEKARKDNLTVIEMELRSIRRDKLRGKASSNVRNRRARIKNAYYALNLIEEAKTELNDIETSQELYRAMNELTESLRMINRICRDSEKPAQMQYQWQSAKMESDREKNSSRLDSLYDPETGIDSLVSDDLVDLLLKGSSVEDCVTAGEGIRASMDVLREQFGEEECGSPGEMKGGPGGSGAAKDYSAMDFTDYHFTDFDDI